MSFKSLDILLNPNKILQHYVDRSVVSEIKQAPISSEIHWTSNCNYDCIHCSYGSRRKTVNYLKSDIIENLIDDLIEMKCQAVYLSGGGEPTVVKRWDSYSDKLILNNVEVALITNGVAIQEKHIPIIQRMNYVAVSIYSTKEDRYREITESRFFDQQFTLPKKVKNNTSQVIVGARCVLNKINYDELHEIYCSAIDAGFDYVIFIPAVDYEGRGVFLEEQWIDIVKENIKDKIDKFDHTRTNVKALLNKKILHYSEKNYLSGIDSQCSSINSGSGVFFNYDGGVYLCQPDIGDSSLEIGNLYDNRFIDIWNS